MDIFNMKVTFKENVIFRDLDDEMIIMDMNSGKYFGLNETGARIWSLLNENQKIKDIIEKLSDEYDITKEQCEKEVKKFISTLLEKGLIDVKVDS